MSVITDKISTILIITNDINVRQSIEQVLRPSHSLLLFAEREITGIELIHSNCPELIIFALTERDFNNLRFFTELRQNLETATIPVIALTTVAEPRQWRKAMEMGADDVLLFPFTATELENAIAARLAKQAAYFAHTQQELEKLRNSIINFLPHEMRTALTGILAASDLLINQLNYLNWSVIREMLNCIYSSSHRLLRLIDNFLLYSELKAIGDNPNIIQIYRNYKTDSVKEKIIAISTQFAQKYSRQDNLNFELQDACVLISEINFTKLIEELIDNACKFSPANTSINISSQISHNQFILTISDCGRGMTPKQIASIDMGIQFERHLYEQQGFGLGLAIARQITQLYGGTLTIDSIPTQQTAVTVKLPLAKVQEGLAASKITDVYDYYFYQDTETNCSF
jgi:signal transduction histidine kinase